MSNAPLVALTLTAALALACSSKSGEPPAGKPLEPAAAAPAPAAAPTAARLPDAPPTGPTGAVRGKVTLTGEPPTMPALQRGSDPVCGAKPMTAETVLVGPGGGLANTVVRVAPGTVPPWAPATPVVVDQVDCMYRPRVQAGVVGQTLEVRNGDATAHNVNARKLAFGQRADLDTVFNRSQPKGSPPVTAPLAGDVEVLKLKCDMHGWMQGFVVLGDNPYAAVTAADGSFVLTGVPAGPRSLQVWHELYGSRTIDVTVEEGKEAAVEVAFDATADRPASMGGATPAAAPASDPG